MLEKNAPASDVKYHYDMIRDNQDKIVDKLNLNLGFFSFRKARKIKGVEVIYDTPNKLLSNAGIVLSKQTDEDGSYFKVRKISKIPTEAKRKSQKFALAKCGTREAPKDFALQVSTAINNSFSNVFTIDLAEVVKKTMPMIEIIVKGDVYDISGGTGFKGSLMFEKVTYKDLVTHKKVKREGVTLVLPSDKIYERDVEAVLEGVERYCKELIPYKESRFEIATRVLASRNKGKLGIKNLREAAKETKQEKEEK